MDSTTLCAAKITGNNAASATSHLISIQMKGGTQSKTLVLSTEQNKHGCRGGNYIHHLF
jgi:hypothetical protein